MRHTLPTVTLVVLSFLASNAEAQQSKPRESYDINVSRRYTPPEAAHRHSSTFYEGARRGEAAWITAAGEFLVDEAQSEILWQHAESLHYENELKKTAAALTRKRMLSDYREDERNRRLLRKQQSKLLWAEKYQELARTYRLNEYQFNWDTGAIYWPATVASPRYAAHRNRLEVLLDRVVRYGQSSHSFDSEEIARLCQDFANQLREDANDKQIVSQQDYSQMRRFLLGLKYAPVLIQSNGSKTLAMR